MTLVIGCGHPDRGDDAAGILVARRLRALGVNAVEHSGDGLALIELWGGAEDVILVDAMQSENPPGTVLVWDPVAEPLCVRNFSCSTHAFGPAEAIELARVVGRLPPRMRIYGIQAAGSPAGAGLTAPVGAAVERVVREIAGLGAFPQCTE